MKASHLSLVSPVRGVDGPTVADRWYAALDNLRLDVDGQDRHARVLGIHSDGTDFWIQLEPVTDAGVSVVLHVTPSATIDDAVGALRARFADLSHTHIIHVTHAA